MPQQPQQPSDERVFIRRVLIVIGLIALALLAWYLRSVLLMLFGAVVVATVFRALAELIERYLKTPRWLATAISILAILGTLVLLVAAFGAQVGRQFQALRESLPAAWRAFEARIGDLGLTAQVEHLVSTISTPGGGSLSAFGRTILSIGGGIADTLIIIVAGIFLAAQPQFYWVGAIKLVPEERRGLVAEAMRESARALRLWLRGQLIAMIAVGLLTGFGLFLLGMPSAFALGLLAGLFEFIPFAGPLLAALPAVLLALAVSPDLALWVVLLYVAVQQLEGNVLTPLVQQYAVEMPGALLLFALLAFGALFGPLGVILAAPLGVVTYVLVKRLYVVETLDTATPIPGTVKPSRKS